MRVRERHDSALASGAIGVNRVAAPRFQVLCTNAGLISASAFTTCHSERSEESRIKSESARNRNRLEMFRFAQHDSAICE